MPDDSHKPTFAAGKTNRAIATELFLSQKTIAAAVVTGGPLVLLGALIYHPFIVNIIDEQAVARALTADTGRWAAAHIGTGIGFGLLLLALLAVNNYLCNSNEGRATPAVLHIWAGASASHRRSTAFAAQ